MPALPPPSGVVRTALGRRRGSPAGFARRLERRGPDPSFLKSRGLSSAAHTAGCRRQNAQSSSSVATALPMTYDDPDPEKKSWFSSAFGESADRMAGFTSVTVDGNIAS